MGIRIDHSYRFFLIFIDLELVFLRNLDGRTLDLDIYSFAHDFFKYFLRSLVEFGGEEIWKEWERERKGGGEEFDVGDGEVGSSEESS